MLVMRTTEDPAYPVCEFVSSQQSVGFYDLALCVYPFGLDGVQPRTLLRKKATHDPYSPSALFDFSVVPSEPLSDLPGDMPTGVIPDEKQDSLASRFEPLATPRKEPRRYGTHRPPVYEPQPRIVEFGQVEAVAGDGLRLGVVFGNRPLDETLGSPFLGPATQGRQGHPAPPAFVGSPRGRGSGPPRESRRSAPSVWSSGRC